MTPGERRFRSRRIAATASIAVLVTAGLGVHFALPDSSASDIAGDTLYTAMIYALVVALVPRRSPAVAALLAALWCIAVELFQLTGLPEQWGAVFPPILLVLGTAFDPRDLVVAVAVLTACALVDAGVPAAAARRR